MRDITGKQISHYQLVEKLGEGGMGVVWKARDPQLNRLVALKVLSPDKQINEDLKRRFLQEARAASALNHPNIVTIYQIGCDDGTDFIAMEYVAGKTLDRIIPRGGMRLGEVLELAVPLADALSKAHDAGIIHRDLKPGNVIVSEAGTPKLLDFGLAKLVETSAECSEDSATRTLNVKTVEGAILGTCAYMSPEQAQAQPVDARSDIFSFGAVMYEMLTGRRAFQGETQLATLTAVMRDDPKPLRAMVADTPPEMERIIARSMRKDPAWRFQTAADLKVALAELQQESHSNMLSGSVAAGRMGRRAMRAAVTLAAIVVAVAAVWRFAPFHRPQEVMRVVPLTSYEGPEREPTFSPDASQFAFAWNAGGERREFGVYVRMVEGGTPLRLTGGQSPAWSPDGKWIAFTRQGSVMLISPLGGPERKVADVVVSPFSTSLAWTPDSASIAVSDDGNLVLISVKTGARRFLTQKGDRVADLIPAFSPDGRSLAFARRNSSGSWELAVSSPPGAPPRSVASSYGLDGIAWAPDGNSLIYAAVMGNTQGIWRIAATATPKEQPEQLPIPPGLHLCISRPGKNGASRMAVETGGRDTNIWRLDLSAGQAVPVISSTMMDYYPQYSPDASRIAFASDRSGATEIWTANGDGSNQVQITSFGSRAAAPRWSPDGHSIVFSSSKGGRLGIYVVDAQGGEPRRLVDGWRPSWSVDGKWIYFGTKRSGSEQIWKVGANGANPVQVTRAGGFELQESADGKWLLYTKSDHDRGLWRMALAGGPEDLILGDVMAGNWSPVAGGILWATGGGMSLAGYSPEVAQTVTRYWFDSGESKSMGRIDRSMSGGTSATQDGRYLLWSRVERFDSDLLLVENVR